MKATVKGKFDADKNVASSFFTFSTPAAGDARLKLSLTDATVSKGPSLQGLTLSLEKPGNFIVDYNAHRNDLRFQFMNTVKFLDKSVNLTYIHFQGDNRTTLDGSMVLDPSNKVSTSYVFGSGNCKVKYVYAHGELRRTVFEPCFDVKNNSWDFALSRKLSGDDVVRASYQTSSKNLGLEWSRNSKASASFKILASVNLDDQQKVPKLIAETTWNYDI